MAGSGDKKSNGKNGAGTAEPIIEVTGLVTRFGTTTIHEDLDLAVRRREVMGLVGGSGTGKSVLLRAIVGLIRPAAGRIEIFGRDVKSLSAEERKAMQRRWAMMFQDGALFSSLTVGQNIELPMREHTDLPTALRHELVELKLTLAGLSPDATNKYPSELSGGMRKRAGLARALALDPEILFLDEPTAGLDPIGAARFDDLIKELSHALGLTIVMVTHDLDSLYAICDRVAVLIDKRVKVGTIDELKRQPDPWIQDYFTGPRGRAAQTSAVRAAEMREPTRANGAMETKRPRESLD